MQTTSREFATPPILDRLLLLQDRLLSMRPTTPLAEVLAAFAEDANEVMGGDFCVVMPYDRSFDKFLVKQFTPGGAPAAKNFEWSEPRPDGTARTILNKRLVKVENLEKEKDVYSFLKEGSLSQGAFRDIMPIEALIGIRLDAADESVGVLVVNYRESRCFSEQEIQTLESFAKLAASAILNARLFESQSRITDTLTSLVEVFQQVLTVGSKAGLEDVLRLTVTAANQILEADMSVLFLYDSKTDRFLMDQLVAAGPGTESYDWQEPRPGGATRLILQEKKPVFWSDQGVNKDLPFASGAFKQHFQIRSAIGVPLLKEDEAFGVLFINYRVPRTLSGEEIQLAQTFAGVAAVAIENARLFQAEREQRTLAEVMRDTASALNTLDFDQVLDHILGNIGRVVKHDAATIMLIETKTARIVRRRGYEERGADTSLLERFDANELPNLRHIIETGTSILISDTQTDDRWIDREDTHWVRSYIGTPILSKGHVIGILNLTSAVPGFFSQSHTEHLRAFADQAAVAIENARYANNLAELLKIAQDLTRAMTAPEQVLEAALRRTVSLFDVTRGAIVLYENGDGRMVAAFDNRPGKTEVGGVIHFHNSPLQRRVRSASSPVILTDVANDELLSPEERKRFLEQDIKTSMILPLVARGRVLGSLGLDETRHVRVFRESEQELAQVLAGLAAIAIDNARIYGVAEKELSGVIQVAQSLVQEALRPGIELKRFLQQVMQQTLSLIEFNAGWLLLQEGDRVKIVATDELHLDDVDRVFLIEDCISGQSMLRKDAINIPDLTKMPPEYERVYKAPRGGTTKSELVVPLMVGDRAIGAFNVESDRTAAFEPRHVEMLKLLSNQVALAIELAQFRSEATALSSVGLDLARATEMGVVVRSSLTNALKLAQGQFGQILLVEGENLVVRYTTNVPPKDIGIRPPINDCVSGLAAIERKSVIVPDVDKPDYYVVEWIETPTGRRGELVPKATEKPRYRRVLEEEKERVHAELAVPLFSGDAVVSVLNIETPRTAGFTLEQRAALESFAASNAERFAQALMGRRELMGELLNGALARADTGFGQILRLDGETLIIEHTTGGEQSGTRVSIHRSVTGRAVREGKSLYVPDVAQDPDYQRYLGEEMKSEMVVPLIIGEDVVGVLNVESSIPRFFTPDHARVLETFAGQAAVAIDRAKRFEIQTLAEVGGVSGDIVHRLNNPLGAISMRLELLKGRSEYPEMISMYPYLDKFIEVVELNTIKAKSTIQELRTAIKGKPPAPTDLQPAIHEALSVANLPENIRVEQSLPDQMIRVTANDRLVNIFWNLFDNARKAMPTGGRLTITVSISADDPWGTVEVRDTGRGIEPWRLLSIFEAGETTTIDPNAPGHGLGLWWVKAQLENFGGEIAVGSELGIGTWVTLKLKKVA